VLERVEKIATFGSILDLAIRSHLKEDLLHRIASKTDQQICLVWAISRNIACKGYRKAEKHGSCGTVAAQWRHSAFC
jgi:hypothetical protein